jgi:hypothetical protein
MALEDFVEPEVAIAVAVTAALSSERARHAMRRGAVYGLAGILKAGDAVKAFSNSVQTSVAGAAALNGEVSTEAGTSPARAPKATPSRRGAHQQPEAGEPDTASPS